MRRGHSRFFCGTVFVILSVVLTSCGEKGTSVPKTGASLEGTVHYGDEQIQFALIIATSPNGSATANVGDDGKYHMDNVPLGEVTVAVNTAAGEGDYRSKTMSGAYKGPQGGSKAGNVSLKFTQVPTKYHDTATSPLKTTVNAGPNTYDIKIPK